MVDVLYRAKRKSDGEWVVGYYAKAIHWLTEDDMHVIFPLDLTIYPHSEFSDFEEIIPETLCRLLRHVDYDAFFEVDRIFQNDIVGIWERHADVENTEPDDIALVLDEHSVRVGSSGRWFPQDTTRIRVIGNAFDNPELLEGRNLNHFVNDLRACPYDYDEYTKRHRHLTKTYDIHGAHACCYMKNFENDYICHQFNGGCDRIDICRRIREEEKHDL